MATQSRKLKLQDKIATLQAQLDGLNQKPLALTRNSQGVPELLEKLNDVIKLHKVDAVDMIEILLKAKRTGRSIAPKE